MAGNLRLSLRADSPDALVIVHGRRLARPRNDVRARLADNAVEVWIHLPVIVVTETDVEVPCWRAKV